MLVEMLLGEMMVDGGESRGSGGAIAAEEINSEWWFYRGHQFISTLQLLTKRNTKKQKEGRSTRG